MSQDSPKTSAAIYDEWYNRLDPIDREIVSKVSFTSDDDYPLEIDGQLSPAAQERGGLFELEKGYFMLAFIPTPPEAYYRAMEREARENAAKRDALRQAMKNERMRMKAWTADLMQKGFVCTSMFRKSRPLKSQSSPRREHFSTGHFSTGNTFFQQELDGQEVWYEEYGNASHLWVPRQMADLWYEAEWQAHMEKNKGYAAFKVLERELGDFSCYGDDLYKWVFERLGKDILIALARENTTIIRTEEMTHAPFISKYYRIPVQYTIGLQHETILTGYGNSRPSPRRIGQSDAEWAAYQRTDGWIPLGDEDKPESLWPTDEDLQAIKDFHKKYLTFDF